MGSQAGGYKRKCPAGAGLGFRENSMLASRVRLQEAPLSLAKLTTRLTNRTLHHLASLDQTEEGPVGKSETGGALSLVPAGGGSPHQPLCVG